VFTAYEQLVAKSGGRLDSDSIRVFCSRVRCYLTWLAGAVAAGEVDGDPLGDPATRDWAARDYRTHLQTVAKRKPSTVNAHLTAVDDFYRRRSLGPAYVKRADIPHAAPRALGKRDQLRLLREADRTSCPRDKAIAYTAFYARTRIAETVALDVEDVAMSARKGYLVIRYGKNGKYREVPLHPKLRTVLEKWLEERAKKWTGAETHPALFLNRRGGRLSARSAYTVLRAIGGQGRAAGQRPAPGRARNGLASNSRSHTVTRGPGCAPRADGDDGGAERREHRCRSRCPEYPALVSQASKRRTDGVAVAPDER
jgi:integrase/recombinase XerC